MKLYHEVAIIKDENKRIGWLLKEGTVSSPSRVFFVTEEQFHDLVKSEKVQNFTVDCSGNLKIAYTKEEMKLLKSLKMKPVTSLRDWIKKDVVLKYPILNEALSGLTPYVYITNGTRILKSQSVLLSSYIYTNNTETTYKGIILALSETPPLNVNMRFMYLLNEIITVAPNYLIVRGLPPEIYKYLGSKLNWNISCKGLKNSLDVLKNNSKNKKEYMRSPQGTELDYLCRELETA